MKDHFKFLWLFSECPNFIIICYAFTKYFFKFHVNSELWTVRKYFLKIQIDKNWNAPSEIISFHCGWCNRTGKVNVATCVLAFISTMYILPAPLQAVVVTCQIAKSFLFYFILKHMLGCFWECRIVWHPPGWRTLKSQVRISNSLNNSKNGTII